MERERRENIWIVFHIIERGDEVVADGDSQKSNAPIGQG